MVSKAPTLTVRRSGGPTWPDRARRSLVAYYGSTTPFASLACQRLSISSAHAVRSLL